MTSLTIFYYAKSVNSIKTYTEMDRGSILNGFELRGAKWKRVHSQGSKNKIKMCHVNISINSINESGRREHFEWFYIVQGAYWTVLKFGETKWKRVHNRGANIKLIIIIIIFFPYYLRASQALPILGQNPNLCLSNMVSLSRMINKKL